MSEIETAQQLLTGKLGWYAAVSGWMLNCRIIGKLVSTHLQNGMTRLLVSAVQSRDEKIDALAVSIIGSNLYRLGSWGIDTLFSIKLPTLTLYKAAKADASGDTQIIEKALGGGR